MLSQKVCLLLPGSSFIIGVESHRRCAALIYKKQYGHPFDTESVVGSFSPMPETIPYLTREPDGFSYAMDPQDILYGLGENIRGINKRGWVYESNCSDDGKYHYNLAGSLLFLFLFHKFCYVY